MVEFCEPEIPDIYWVNNLKYKCKNCWNFYDIVIPNGDDVWKFKEIDGDEIRWLPNDGIGGYDDLKFKLAPQYSPDNMTKAQYEFFIKELNKHCEQGKTGNGFGLCVQKYNCPNCKSKDTEYLSEEVLTKPKLPWLKISCDLMNQGAERRQELFIHFEKCVKEHFDFLKSMSYSINKNTIRWSANYTSSKIEVSIDYERLSFEIDLTISLRKKMICTIDEIIASDYKRQYLFGKDERMIENSVIELKRLVLQYGQAFLSGKTKAFYDIAKTNENRIKK